MEVMEASVKIESLSDTNFHTWKQKIFLVLVLLDLKEYIWDASPEDDDSTKLWPHGDGKAWDVIGLSISNEHFEHVSDESSTK